MHCAEITCFLATEMVVCGSSFSFHSITLLPPSLPHSPLLPAFCLTSAQLCDCIKQHRTFISPRHGATHKPRAFDCAVYVLVFLSARDVRQFSYTHKKKTNVIKCQCQEGKKTSTQVAHVIYNNKCQM